jgi:hypothetical protein
MAQSGVQVDLLARDLVRLLADLVSMHAELADHAREKLEAIRCADADRIQSILAREMLLADRIAEREGLRRQIVRKLAEGLGLRVGRDAGLRLTELAEHFTEPRRSQLLVAAAGLRDKLVELQRLHHTHSLVTQEMLKHLGEVLKVMRGGGAGLESYTSHGRREHRDVASVFEAVG